MSVDPTCEHCGEEYDQNSEHRCEPNHQQVRALESIVDALVDYVEAADAASTDCFTCELDVKDKHEPDCKFVALMRAAGRR